MDTKAVLKTFFDAVKSNDITKTTELLKNEIVDVNAKNEEIKDRTALHLASENGYYDLARILVDDFNADVNIKDKTGKIPLQIGCDYYKIKIVKYLLEKNSDRRDYAERFLNEKVVDEFFEAAAENNINKVVEMLKEKKVDVDVEDKGNHRRTVLEIAASNGYEEMVRILVDEFGADILHEDNYGETAKHMADVNFPSLSQFFIERGWDDKYSDDSDDETSESNVKPVDDRITV